jgi:hypothetical protein
MPGFLGRLTEISVRLASEAETDWRRDTLRRRRHYREGGSPVVSKEARRCAPVGFFILAV